MVYQRHATADIPIMSTDTARLPPLPPIAGTPVATTTPVATLPQQDGNDLLATAARNTPERAEGPITAKKASFLPQRANDLLFAVTVLLAGISALMWANLLDATDSQWFVTTAATASTFTSAVLFITLRSFRRQEPRPIPTM